jgi:hypothetical protein
MKSRVFAAAFSLALALPAWSSDFLQGMVVGAGATLIIQDQQRRSQPQVIIQQPPPRVVVVPSPNQLHRTPRPTRQELCHFPGYHARVYDQYDMVMGYRVCY